MELTNSVPHLEPFEKPQVQQSDHMFSDVVLCVKKENDISCFECHKFNTYLEAYKYFKENYISIYNKTNQLAEQVKTNQLTEQVTNKQPIIFSAMFSVCKFMPEFLEKKEIQYKTAQIFNNIKLETNISNKLNN